MSAINLLQSVLQKAMQMLANPCPPALLLVAALGTPAYAQPPGTTSTSSVTASTSHNIYAFGGAVRTAEAVMGDFVGFGGRVVVDRPVKGDALLAGGSISVRAPVDDDVRAAGGDISIEERIGGELYAAGGNIALTKSAHIAQSAILTGGLITIDGKIAGPLNVNAQHIVLNGEVGGNARMVAEEIELGPTARIDGSLNYFSHALKKSESAIVRGGLSRDENLIEGRPRETSRHWMWHKQYLAPRWFGTVFGYLGLLAAATVFLVVFPKFSNAAPDQIRAAPWRSLLIGFGVLIGVPMLAVLLFITLLGIPLGIAVVALYPLLLLLGYLIGAIFVAQRTRLILRKDSLPTFGSTLGLVALALLILLLISSLPVVGPLIAFITTIAGIGAGVFECYHRDQVTTALPT